MSEIFSFQPSERGTRIFASDREPKEVLFREGDVRIKDATDPDAEWVELTRKRIDKAVDLAGAGKVMVLQGDELT